MKFPPLLKRLLKEFNFLKEKVYEAKLQEVSNTIDTMGLVTNSEEKEEEERERVIVEKEVGNKEKVIAEKEAEEKEKVIMEKEAGAIEKLTIQ